MKVKHALMSAMLAASVTSINPIQAQTLDAQRFYVGGGLGFNSLPGYGSARGFQFFGGYNLETVLNDDIKTALEMGYSDSGKFDRLNTAPKTDAVKGLWFSALESVPVSSKTDVQARLGYDFGDDDGFILGAGVQYKFDTRVAMRMEYVTREHYNGLQANVLVNF
jgi:opacity protein-like surface antigen